MSRLRPLLPQADAVLLPPPPTLPLPLQPLPGWRLGAAAALQQSIGWSLGSCLHIVGPRGKAAKELVGPSGGRLPHSGAGGGDVGLRNDGAIKGRHGGGLAASKRCGSELQTVV